MSEGTSKNEGFSNIMGFIFTAIGFAVGVGSLWRFPYVMGSNGGALFIICYIVIILLIGVPLLTAEISMGFASQKTPIQAYQTLAPGKKWYLGAWLHIAAAVLIVGYTIPIYAWILKYIVATAMGTFEGMTAAQITAYFVAFSSDKTQIFIYGAINYLLTAIVVKGGLQKGVERVSRILLPVLAVIMIIIIVQGLRLPGSAAGVTFLLKPNTANFTMNSLITCLGQAFFAVGIAMLASMVFGSYIKNPKENIFKSASVICTALVCAGLMAGFMIFPMVFAAGLEPAGSVGLTFLTLPNVFNVIPLGRVIGVLFYFGFYIAAFTSTLGVVEALTGTFTEQFDMKRGKAIGITMLLCTCVAVPSILSDAVFNTLDMIENNYILIIGALIIAVFVGWVWKMDNCLEAINVKSKFVKGWMIFSVKYLSPIVIIFIFASQFFGK
ncbi:MAG: sodium-dependent transporter [Eubacteriaceae bacterium]|jgi:Na+-dependent transporters of the SNF family|nr:sodium-dependent transporter [Eubacteriaceae bacterium]